MSRSYAQPMRSGERIRGSGELEAIMADSLAFPAPGAAPPPPHASRSRQDLGGRWERHVHGKQFDVVQVPSSLHPLGYYKLHREFLLPKLP
ncbi:MAG: hypothetical protein ACREP9_11505, partial [Candidatus Dormibacteraceae bacterium]